MGNLAGVRIAVTRTAAQSRELAELFEAAGAQVMICPLIKIEPVTSGPEVRAIIGDLAAWDWVFFTSVNGVEQFLRHITDAGAQESLRSCRIACVGPATAAAVRSAGFTPDFIPSEFAGEPLAAELCTQTDIRGKRVLLARAAGGGAELPAALQEAGADVSDLKLYRSILDESGAARLRSAAQDGKIDLVALTSGSTVSYFVETVGRQSDMVVAVIGPRTAQVAYERGLRVDIEANPHTMAGLVEAVTEYYAGRRD